jgi:DNA-binding CsgD family transcriptional regulator
VEALEEEVEHGSKPLSAATAAVYTWSLDHGRIDIPDLPELAAELGLDLGTAEEALRGLIELKLLYHCVDDLDSLLPTSPDAAAAQLMSPIEQEIRQLEGKARESRSRILSLRSLYFENRQQRNRREAIDVINGVERVRWMLSDASRTCSVEVFAAHPGIFSKQAVEASLKADIQLLARGVHMRSLFQHPARVNPLMRELMDQLTAAGCKVRTCEEITDRIIIFDRETVFIPNRLGPDGAVVLREPATVDFLYRNLDQEWACATPYEQQAGVIPGYGVAGDEVKRAIVRLLASGAKDDLIARRLSLSVRTCRRHIAEIMEDVQATSRFQAGVKLAQAGLVSTVDQADEPAEEAPTQLRDAG